MFCRHNASNHTLAASNQQFNSTSAHALFVGGQLSAVRPRWGWHGRALHVTCSHGRSSNTSSVRTAVAAPNTHQLTCQTSSSMQDLLVQVVRSTTHRVHKQQQQHHVPREQQQATPQLSFLEEHPQTQTSPIDPCRTGSALQEQQRSKQQHQQQQLPLEQQLEFLHRQRHMQPLEQQQHQLPQHAQHHAEHQQQRQPQGVLHNSPTDRQEQVAFQQQQHPQPRQLDPQATAAAAVAGAQSSNAAAFELDVLAAGERRTAAGASIGAAAVQPRRQPHGKHMRGWSKQEALQGFRFSQHDNIARTAEGIAMVRISSSSQPQRTAAQLLAWLQKEQSAVLSAAGASLSVAALEAVAELLQQLEQQHPQCQLLVTAEARSSSRPQGGGRCQVYNLVCQLASPASQADCQDSLTTCQDPSSSLSLQQQERRGEASQAQRKGTAKQQRLRQEVQQMHLLKSMQPDLNMQQKQQHQQHELQQQHKQLPPAQLLQQQQLVEASCFGKAGSHGHARYIEQQQQHLDGYQQLRAIHDDWGLAAAAGVAAAPGALQGQAHQLGTCCHAVGDQQHQHLNGSCGHQQLHQVGAAGVELHHRLARHRQNVQLQLQHHQHQHQPLQPQEQHQQQLEPSAVQQPGIEHAPQQQAAAPTAAVQQLDVRGSCYDLADVLEETLLQFAAVCLPVAYPKQAVKVLEAAALLNRRWQQQALRHQHSSHSSSSSRRSSRSSSSSSSSSSVRGHDGTNPGSSGCMQLVLHPRAAVVQRQSGLRPGLHVFMFAVPFVH